MPDDKQITPATATGAKVTLELRWREADGEVKHGKAEYEIKAGPVTVTDPNTKRKMLWFDLQSTNTEPLDYSAPGAESPTILPARAPGSYYLFPPRK